MSGRPVNGLGPSPHSRRHMGQWERELYDVPPVEFANAVESQGPRSTYSHPSHHHTSPPSLVHAPQESSTASGFRQMELPSPPVQEHDPHNYDVYKGFPSRHPMPVSPPGHVHQQLPPSSYDGYTPVKEHALVRSRLAHQNQRNGHHPPAATYYSSTIAPRQKRPGQSGDSQHLSRASTEQSSSAMSPPPINPPRQQVAVPGKSAGIPNLLGPSRDQMVSQMQFRLSMRQQPKAARACGSGERDRRNIDPPPIVQLHVQAPGLTEEDARKYLKHEGYVMNCWIYDEAGVKDMSGMPSEYRYQRRLTGSLVGTPFYGRDENGSEGCFFPFSDLSVRTLGRYRIKFNLIMLDTGRPGQNTHFPVLADIFSGVFDVYTAKEFPGINESSMLVRSLREQGCIISIKKGNDKKKKKAKTVGYDDDDEGAECDDDPYD